MSSKWRRFEVLLLLQFNDGRPVPPEWLAEAVLEVVDHFGAVATAIRFSMNLTDRIRPWSRRMP